MGKFLKKYNQNTKQWEIISEPSVEIVEQIDLSGEPITDNNIRVTNPYYTQNSASTLNDALFNIGDDISELQRNVSWLAEHGGGGGGGGTTGGGYGIVITSPILENNKVYIDSSSLTVKFMITGGTDAETCTYRYTFDGTETSNQITTTINKENVIKLENISESSKHTLTISAINYMGGNIVPVSFSIYQKGLSISLNTNPLYNDISNNEVLLSMGDASGNVYFDIKNTLSGSTTTISYTYGSSEPGQVSYKTTKTNTTIPINIWKVIDRAEVSAGNLFSIGISVQAILDDVKVNTDVLYFNVRIVNPNEMAIFFNGLTYTEDAESGLAEPKDIEQSDLLTFSFRVTLPASTSYKIYYAIQLNSKDGSIHKFIEGNSLDDDLESINKQATGNGNGENISESFALAALPVSNEWDVLVKAWTSDGSQYVIRHGIFNIIESNNNIFPRQHQLRSDDQSSIISADTCLFAWSYKSDMIEDNGRNVWENEMPNTPNYWPQINGTELIAPKAYINLYNTNRSDSGFIKRENEISYLRLQNEAYAIADMSEYQSEIEFMTNDRNHGFDISVTFMCDEEGGEEKTLFFFGTNDSDGNLTNGCKITTERAYWFLNGTNEITTTLNAYIRQDTKNTVDFVYDNVNGTAYLYINGIINKAFNIGKLSTKHNFPVYAYFGCNRANDGTLNYFADTNIYEFAIYTKLPNPLQIAVNRKNAQLEHAPSIQSVITDYISWKHKNLIYTDEDETSKALSYLINEDKFEYDTHSFEQLRENSPVPVLRLDLSDTTFTEKFFHDARSKSDTKDFVQGKAYYYDPSVNKNVEFNVKVAVQGTTTLSYYVKNLEIKVDETTTSDSTKNKLFQPKSEWFPENEFTLKADIIDSAHANNATIGYWINNESGGIFEENPAMKALTDDYRPKDRIRNLKDGETEDDVCYKHTDSRDETGEKEINYDEKVKIKHAVEGFQIILFIKFGRTESTSSSNTYKLIGIYSFNLGRKSYYNLGLSFLDAFSRRNLSYPETPVDAPAIVDYYQEHDRTKAFGNGGLVKPNEIFSYEFGPEALTSGNEVDYCLWSQDDLNIIKYVGEFNFNGNNINDDSDIPTSTWTNIQKFFNVIANIDGNEFRDDDFEGKIPYTCDQKGNFSKIADEPRILQQDLYDTLPNVISIKNALSYFVVASAFGMTDSFGKNLTLRTWNNGKLWYTCFYDMDTAFALNNEGAEETSPDVYLDTYKNDTPAGETTSLVTTRYNADGGYNLYHGKLWALFRDSLFLYNSKNLGLDLGSYDDVWTILRRNGGVLDSHLNMVNLIIDHVGNCGELLYDYDYYNKYIEDTTNISMLNGLRIEYIRSWLQKRFYFLDGVFSATTIQNPVYKDSPYNTNKFNVTNGGSENLIKFVVRANCPTFIKINTGMEDEEKLDVLKTIFLKANTDTEITTPKRTGTQQTQFTTSSVLTKLTGLDQIQVRSMSTTNQGSKNVLPYIDTLNLNNTKNMYSKPIDFKLVYMKKDEETGKYLNKSALENVYLNGSIVQNGGEYPIDLQDFTKIKEIDIANSNVSSIALPNSILKKFTFSNSNITIINLKNQPILKTLNFDGCNKLNTINIDTCNAITSLTIENLSVLEKITISGCQNLKELTIKNNKALNSITLENLPNLETLTIVDCIRSDLKISIDVTGIKTLILNNLETIIPVNFIVGENSFNSLQNIDCSNFYSLSGFTYNNAPLSTYDYHYIEGDVTKTKVCTIVDLSRFINLKNIRFTNVKTLEILRVKNIEDDPFVLDNEFIFDSNTNLKRIFGHISLQMGISFSNQVGFYINDPETYDERTLSFEEGNEGVSFFEGNEVTNITVDTAELSGTFGSTSCGLEDVYYILKQCGNVTSLKNAFISCLNIHTNAYKTLNKDMFKYCTNVTNIDGLFNECQIHSYLHNDLLQPLSKITSLNETFGTAKGYRYGISSTGEFFSGLQIKKLTSFNPVAIDQSLPKEDGNFDTRDVSANQLFIFDGFDHDYETPFNGDFLQYLDLVTEIYDSFKCIGVKFDANMLSYAGKLQVIVNSFQDLWLINKSNPEPGHYETIYNIFGAKVLKTITSSLSIVGPEPDDYVTRGVRLILTNNMFNDIKTTVEHFGGSYDSLSKTFNYNTSTEHAFIYSSTFGSESKTALSGVIKTISEDGFPYDILSECTKLKSACGIFNGMINENEYTIGTLNFPSNIFKNLTSLENASYCFANINIPYELTSDGFKNCSKINNLENIFSGSSAIKGMIPYHLFYNKNKTITNLSGWLSNCTSYNLNMYTCSQELYETYKDENIDNEYGFNIYLFDGTNNFFSYLEDETSEGVQAFKAKYPVYPANTLNKILFKSTAESCTELINCAQKTNYFCPPDLYLYMSSSVKEVKISNSFAGKTINVEPLTLNNVHIIKGRIPPYLFKNLKNLYDASGLFVSCYGILPYKYPTYTDTEDGERVYNWGILYPPQLFEGLSISNISNLFSYTRIFGICETPTELISNIGTTLLIATGVWSKSETIIVTDSNRDIVDKPVFNGNLFSTCINLIEIGNMFYQYGNLYTPSVLFNYSNNPNIENVASFMCESSPYRKAISIVPSFWNNFDIKSYSKCYNGLSYEIEEIKIIQSYDGSEIPQRYIN